MSTAKQLERNGYTVVLNDFGAIIGVRKGDYIAYNSRELKKLNSRLADEILINRPLISNPIEEEKLIDLLDACEHNEYYTNYLNLLKEKYKDFYKKPEFDKILVYCHIDNSHYSLD